MKHLRSTFWLLYMLFFAIPFPMLLYYLIKGDNPPDLANTPGWLALGLTALSLLLWIIVLAGYFRNWILAVFTTKRNIGLLKANGIHREATILSSRKVSAPGAPHDTYELELAFLNLVNTPIVQKAAVNDAKPYERRFEAGKKTALLLDQDMRHIPYFMFASTEARINKMTLTRRIAGWLLFIALVAGYYVFAYQMENDGAGWRFLTWWHPLLVCPVILLLYRGFGAFIDKVTGQPGNAALIKFKGVRTRARLLGAAQTGTYINEQPMVRFELEYPDEQQQPRRASYKKVVDLLHLDITRQEHIDIFYLRDDPTQIAFAADLDEIS